MHPRPAQYRQTTVNEGFTDSAWGDTLGVFRKADDPPKVALGYIRKMIESHEGTGKPSP